MKNEKKFWFEHETKRDQRLFYGTVERVQNISSHTYKECKLYANYIYYSLLICGSIADFQQTVQRDNGAVQPYSIK